MGPQLDAGRGRPPAPWQHAAEVRPGTRTAGPPGASHAAARKASARKASASNICARYASAGHQPPAHHGPEPPGLLPRRSPADRLCARLQHRVHRTRDPRMAWPRAGIRPGSPPHPALGLGGPHDQEVVRPRRLGRPGPADLAGQSGADHRHDPVRGFRHPDLAGSAQRAGPQSSRRPVLEQSALHYGHADAHFGPGPHRVALEMDRLGRRLVRRGPVRRSR